MKKSCASKPALVAGVISDTHGLLRPAALAALAGSDVILHAGDIGSPEILAALSAIAPVIAVRGNNDRGAWAEAIPETAIAELGGARIYLIHDRNQVDFDPAQAGFAAVVAGHSHKPLHELKDGVLQFNPGSAGPRRFSLPIALGRLTIQDGRVTGAHVFLDT